MGNRSNECFLPLIIGVIFLPSILLFKEYGGLIAGTGLLAFGFLYLRFEEKICNTKSRYPIGVILIGLTCYYIFFRRLFDPTVIDDAVQDQNSWEWYAILSFYIVVMFFFRHRTGETIVKEEISEKKMGMSSPIFSTDMILRVLIFRGTSTVFYSFWPWIITWHHFNCLISPSSLREHPLMYS